MAKEGSIYRKGDYEYQVRGGKAYNFNVPKKDKKSPAPVKKAVPTPAPKPTPKADAAPKPKAEAPAPKKVESAAPKAPVYTKDAPGSAEEAQRGPVSREERIRIVTAPTKRDLDTMMNATSLVGAGSKLAARIGSGLLNRASKSKLGKEAMKYLPKDIKALGAPPKLLTGPKPAAPRTSPPARLNAPEKPKLLEYKPTARSSGKKPPKPKPRTEGQGSFNFRNGGGINGAAVRGRTKGRMV